MEDFPDTEIIDILLPKLEQVESGELRETTWDGQAFPALLRTQYGAKQPFLPL